MSYPYVHSLALLKALVEDPPPLVPDAALRAAAGTYERFRGHPPADASEIEDAIIAYGRVLWPYRKALESLMREEFHERASTHFVVHLESELRSAYDAFLARGGSLNDLHDGATMPTGFTVIQRGQLCEALLAARARALVATRAAIASDDREYRKRIREFQALQHELEEHIHALRRLAERAADHADVVSEIMETVRMFERGLANLAREPEVRTICAALEAYRERHEYTRDQRAEAARPKIFG